MKTTAYATLLLAALALSGCSRNTNQTAENSHMIRVCQWVQFYLGFEPLVVQVSEGSKAYIWQFSKVAPADDGISWAKDAPASTLDDVLPQAALYKQARDQQKKPALVVITGDDHAKCGAVFEAIANAKYAGITAFYFETTYRKSGETSPMTSWEGAVEKPTYNINLSGNPITITISENDALMWENKPITIQDYVNRLTEIRDAIRSESVYFVVKADARASFGILRYVLAQLPRAKDTYDRQTTGSLTIELRELK